MTRRRDCLMTPHFLKWSFGPKIEYVDGICQQTDSMNRFYLDVKTGPKQPSLPEYTRCYSSQTLSTVSYEEIFPRNFGVGGVNALLDPSLAPLYTISSLDALNCCCPIALKYHSDPFKPS